ncbi:hypothetical protein ACSSVY_000030 [Roseovarius sp. MBR-51]
MCFAKSRGNPPKENALNRMISKPRYGAPCETANSDRSHGSHGDGKSKPSFAFGVLMLSVVVSAFAFAAGVISVGSVWWAVLIAYASQLSFVLLVVGGYFVLQTDWRPAARRDPTVAVTSYDRLIDTDPAVWISYQPKQERLNRVRRVAVSAASDRDSRKCCEWLAEYECEVHLCSDHDTMIGDLTARPERWSLLIIDADHIGGLEAVPRELEYIRSGLGNLPILFLSGRPEQEVLGALIPRDQNLVMAKPFFRKSLFAALEKLNLKTARDHH